MTTSKLIIRSSIARISITILAMIVSFFMMPFLIKQLGDRWYGILAILTALAGYYYFVDFGLHSAVTRFFTLYVTKEDTENANVIINTSLVIYSLLALLIVILALGVMYFAYHFIDDAGDMKTIRLAIIIMGMTLAFEFPFKAFTGVLGAYLRYDLLSYSHFLTLFLNTVLTIYFLNSGYGIIALVSIGLATSVLSNILYYLIARHIFAPMRLSMRYVQKTKIRELFSYSVWTFVMQIGEQLRYRIDSFVIGWFLSATAVTHYSVGAAFPLAVITLVYRATNFILPVFTKYHAQNNNEELKDKLILATKINAIIAGFGGGLLIIIGKPLITRWIGSGYSDAYPVLVILTVGIIFEAIQNPSNTVLMAVSKHKYFACTNIFEGVSKLILSFLLVKQYGILGVAVGSVIPLIVCRMLIMPYYVARTIGMPLLKYYSPVVNILAGTCLYLSIVFLISYDYLIVPEYIRLIITSLFSVPVYFGMVIFTFFNADERKLIFISLPFKNLKSIFSSP